MSSARVSCAQCVLKACISRAQLSAPRQRKSGSSKQVDMELAGEFEGSNVWKVKDRPDGTCGWQWLKSLKNWEPNVTILGPAEDD